MSKATITGPVPPSEGQVRRILIEEQRQAVLDAVGEGERLVKMQLQNHRRTGALLRSWTRGGQGNVFRLAVTGTKILAEFGSNLDTARYLNDGTGIYGPRKRPITAKNPGGVLAWPIQGAGVTLAGRRRSGAAGRLARFAYARSVKGIKPLHYVEAAQTGSRRASIKHFEAAGRRAALRIKAARA